MVKGFMAGVMIANAFEWVAHKYLLHGVHRQGQQRFSLSPSSMKSHWTHGFAKEIFYYVKSFLNGQKIFQWKH